MGSATYAFLQGHVAAGHDWPYPDHPVWVFSSREQVPVPGADLHFVQGDVAGPHHIHTNGEIGAVMPIQGEPRFDDFAPGWYVYPPGSDHHPTVSGGDAYVLYLLPEGAIEFTGK